MNTCRGPAGLPVPGGSIVDRPPEMIALTPGDPQGGHGTGAGRRFYALGDRDDAEIFGEAADTSNHGVDAPIVTHAGNQGRQSTA